MTSPISRSYGPLYCVAPALLHVLLAAFAVGCSGSSNQAGGAVGGVAGVGGASNVAGAFASGGATTKTTVTGTGGGLAGSSAGGAATGLGGQVSSGGSEAATSVVLVGGSTATGGATSKGGSTATGGATSNGGSTATGGTSGGATAIGGTSSTGGSTATDRCDVGVYDAANPPKVLTLTGSTATHDPAAIQANGAYYLYDTGLGAKTSANMTAWTGAASPLATPAWMATAIPGVQGLWAPDVSYFNGQYHLYYAGSYPFGANTSCIGHATRAAMNAGSWTDQGSSIICSSSANNWNAIDPNLVLDTAGTPWLAFGSFWSGIQLVQLNAAGTARANTTTTLIAGRGGSGLEAPFIVRRCGYYYLFTSWDACCKGFGSTYNIRVGRSTSINGGYVDKTGKALTAGGGTLVATGDGTTFNGPGGQSVLFVGTKAYLVYHAYAPNSVVGGAATLRIADLVWDSSGWPVPVGP